MAQTAISKYEQTTVKVRDSAMYLFDPQGLLSFYPESKIPSLYFLG